TVLVTLSLHDALPISSRHPWRGLLGGAAASPSPGSRRAGQRLAQPESAPRAQVAHPFDARRALRAQESRGASRFQREPFRAAIRSEEHTSELQSPYDL